MTRGGLATYAASMGLRLRTRFAISWRLGRAGRPIASLGVIVLAATAYHMTGQSSAPSATAHGPLIAYTIPKATPYWRSGEVSFTLAQGSTPIATWTHQVGALRFGGLGGPAFTADGKYAFAQYSDEQAGRSPYDGGDIHAELVWVDVASRRVREAPVPARSRTPSQQPARPGAPYALQGSTVVWQAPASPDAANGQVTLMQLDLSQANAAPSILRTVQLPPRNPVPRPLAQDFTGDVVGAGHGRVVIAQKYGDDVRTQADRLYFVDTDGAIRDLGHLPTIGWGSAIFSRDGTRFAYETGKDAGRGGCNEHQVTVFVSATGHPDADFPRGPFDATPKPYFYGNESGAVWWTPDGKLRATGSAEKCPANLSEPTPDAGVWELSGSHWTQIDAAGTYRDYPFPNGEAAMIVKEALPPDKQKPNEPSTVTSLFISHDGRRVHVADTEASDVAVAPA
jgi:hypothetical protein